MKVTCPACKRGDRLTIGISGHALCECGEVFHVRDGRWHEEMKECYAEMASAASEKK